MPNEASPPIKNGDFWQHKSTGRIVLVKGIVPSNWPKREGEPVVTFEEIHKGGTFEDNFRRYYEPAPDAVNAFPELTAEVKRLREALELAFEAGVRATGGLCVSASDTQLQCSIDRLGQMLEGIKAALEAKAGE